MSMRRIDHIPSLIYTLYTIETESQPIRRYPPIESHSGILEKKTALSTMLSIANPQIIPKMDQPRPPFTTTRQKGVYVPAMSR
jgi:hypothetical protein